MKKVFAVAASLILIVISANAQTDKKKTPPPPPPKPKEEVRYDVVKEEKTEPPVLTVQGNGADEFYKRNPTVADISRKGSVITIKKKDGTIEKYDMNKKEEDKSFTEKYGAWPIPPPPPPPKK